MHYPPPVHGAAMVGKYIKDSALINADFKTKYINLGISQKVGESGKRKWRKIVRYLNVIVASFKQLFLFNPNLVYITLTSSGMGFYKDAFIVLLAKLFGKKVVFHFHNKGVRKAQGRFFDDWLYRIIFKDSEVILLSLHLYPDVEKYVSIENIHICQNGIPEMAPETVIPETQLNGPAQILFLSNLLKSKGVFELLEACQILKERGIPFHCTFIGDTGDIDAELFKYTLQEMNVQDRVAYVGCKYGEDKNRAYREADVFVLYTHDDCFPLVLLEAMQHSLPVITTAEGGIPDIVEDGKSGYLVSKNNVSELAQKLEEVITNRTLQQSMGANARLRYESRYTLQAFEDRLYEILCQLVSKNEEHVSSVKKV